MQTLTLRIKSIQALNQIQTKLLSRKPLTSEQHSILANLLAYLPNTEILVSEKYLLNNDFEIRVLDMKVMWPNLKKWINLFNNLPKNGDSDYPHAGWIDAEEDSDLWRTNSIIVASFIPSLAYSKKGVQENRIIRLHLKTDGTAAFKFWFLEDAENFPELYSFDGSWKEAYLLVVKTLKQGWPQTEFPKEFETLLS